MIFANLQSVRETTIMFVLILLRYQVCKTLDLCIVQETKVYLFQNSIRGVHESHSTMKINNGANF